MKIKEIKVSKIESGIQPFTFQTNASQTIPLGSLPISDNDENDLLEILNVEEKKNKRKETACKPLVRKSRRLNPPDPQEKILQARGKKDEYFRSLPRDSQLEIIRQEEEVANHTKSDIPLRYRILQSPSLEISFKSNILQRLDQYESLKPYDVEHQKLSKWIHSLERLPFDHLIPFPVDKNSPLPQIRAFMERTSEILNQTIYGQERAKMRVLEVIAQRITNPESVCSAIALVGSAGVGKTSLIKNGVSRALHYPFAFTALGGISDGAYLEGHSYTYEGSHYGRIIEMLMETQCMNPIIFFDELDKISESEKGKEIMNLLIHITDTTQNNHFMDKYLSGFKVDLSKCILFFSLNDISEIHPILRDRLTVIEFDKYEEADKVAIFQHSLYRELCENIGLSTADYIFSPEIIRYMINQYCEREDGIRNLKRCLEKILLRINYDSYVSEERRSIQISSRPYQIQKEDVDKIMKKKRETIDHHLSLLYS